MMTGLATRRPGRLLAMVCVAGLCSGRVADAQQLIGGCSVLPTNNIWNTAVDALPVLANSASMVTTIGGGTGFHADFGSGTWNGGAIGIPFVPVSGSQTTYPATFLYANESDPGPYAVPLDAPIEGGSNSTGDRHAISVDTQHCLLYEFYSAYPGPSSWSADSGAIYDLTSNVLRPATWTSADAAGLPIVPGLVTYDEVMSGEVTHAIRFTAPRSRREYVWPARHYASSLTGTQYPRMGERFRLKASVNITAYPADVQVILQAMEKYGIMLADNGSAWYISGAPDNRWNNTNLHTLGQLLGSNFEAVDATVLRIDPDSGAALQTGVSVTVSPSTASVRTGRTRIFAATVTGPGGPVSWSVDGIPGGDVVVGTIAASGQYTAPSVAPSPAVVTVRATTTSPAPVAVGSSSVTVLPQPALYAVTQSSTPTGFALTIDGIGFTAGSVVSFDGRTLVTTWVSSTQLAASGRAPTVKPSVPVVVTTTDGETSNTVFLGVMAPAPVSITVSPSPGALRPPPRARPRRSGLAPTKRSSSSLGADPCALG